MLRNIKKLVALCLIACVMLSVLPSPAYAESNVIYVDDGSTVTFEEVRKGNGDGYEHSLRFTVNGTTYYMESDSSSQTKYSLQITNGTVTTGTPYYTSWYDRYTFTNISEKNLKSVLNKFTTDSDSKIDVLQVAVYPSGNGSGTPPIYAISTPKDTTPPSLTLTQSTRSLTNLPITITASATDVKAMHDIPYKFNDGAWTSSKTFRVTENGTYTVQARDKANNIVQRDISITNIDTLPPTFFVNSLLSPGDGSKVLVAVLAQDNSMAAMQYSFNDGATWQNEYTCELPVDVEVTIKVKDVAGNMASSKFIPKAPITDDGSGSGSALPSTFVTIENNSDIEKTIYGTTGIVNPAGNYQTYSAASKRPGIELKINASASAKNRFMAGSAVFAGKEYPIHWDNINGEQITSSAEANGYIFIDKAEFKSNYKNARIKVSVYEYTDAAAKTRVSEGTSSLAVSVDTSPPTISVNVSRATNSISIDTFDSISGVKNILYSIDGSSFVAYTAPFNISQDKRSITVVAVDKLENKATETTALTSNDIAADSVDANIYTYKSKNAIFYIINGNKSNTDTINLSDFNMNG